MFATEMINEKKFLEAVKAFEKYGAPANQQVKRIYYSVQRLVYSPWIEPPESVTIGQLS